MRTTLLLSVFALMVSAPTALVACSAAEKESTDSSESNVNSEETSDAPAYCWDDADCEDGLLCKPRPSGPPPGAVGLPLPAGSAEPSMPPGAVGLPLPPNTCQKPAEGEVGSKCISDGDCNDGLECAHGGSSSSGGPPPGAVGMPVPAGEGHSFPPGAMGMPMPRFGKCAVKSGSTSSSTGGPPPGALGLPIVP